MTELEKLRNEINAIDEQMAQLFERRMQTSGSIAAYKREHGLSVRDRAREQQLIDHNRSYIEDAEIETFYIRFLEVLMDLSRQYQARQMSRKKTD